MKRVNRVFLAAACLMLAATVLPVTRALAQPGVVTDANLNEMIKKAKTPSDHEMIAEYYDKEAAENENKAKLHRMTENMYFKTANRLHCNGLIKAYEAAAAQDTALAAYHREMAKKAASETGH